ncbi:MAG: hypothetical protein ACYDAY_08400 [Candidatus Dormibacteria bacterium]
MSAPAKAALRLYLGCARGCGTTTAMLAEARRRAGRGTDVVVGAHRVHGDVVQALDGLRSVRGQSPTETRERLDPEAVMARNPEVVCVDDVAAPDVSGQPVYLALPGLLAAGITVLGTLHALDLREIALATTAVTRRGSSIGVIDDQVLALVDELEVVDIAPADLLERLRRGAILTPAEVARGLQGELRPEVLQVLREASLRLVAAHIGGQAPAGVDQPMSAAGRVVLCLPPEPGLEAVVRAVAGHASRQEMAFEVVVVGRRSMPARQRELLGAYASITHQESGSFVRLAGRRTVDELARHLRDARATEVVLLRRRAGRRRPRRGTTMALIHRLEGVDVHILRAGARGGYQVDAGPNR